MPLQNGQDLAARHLDRASAYNAVHGYAEHELNLFAAFLPDGFEGSDTAEPLPTLVQVDPTPRMIERPLDTVIQRDGQAAVAVRLQSYLVTHISRDYTEVDLTPRYWLVVAPGVTPAAADARDRKYTRYVLHGSPGLFEDQWQLTLVEEK